MNLRWGQRRECPATESVSRVRATVNSYSSLHHAGCRKQPFTISTVHHRTIKYYRPFPADPNLVAGETHIPETNLLHPLCCNWTSSDAPVTLIVFTTATMDFPEGAESNAAFLHRR
jgi:hypothetical protein